MGGFAAGRTRNISTDDGALKIEDKVPVRFWDSVSRGFDDGYRTRNAFSLQENYRQRVDVNRWAIEKATGKRAPRPMSVVEQESVIDLERPVARFGDFLLGIQVLGDDEYDRWVEEERAKNPEDWKGIKTISEIRGDIDTELKDVRQRANEAGPVGAFIGGMGGETLDPVNALSAILTGGLGATRSLGTRVLMQAGAGAGTEVVQAPGRARTAEDIGGPEYTLKEGVADVAMGAAGGAAFEAAGDVVRFSARQLRKAMPKRIAEDPELAGAVNALERQEVDSRIIGEGSGGIYHEEARAAIEAGSAKINVPEERDIGQIFAEMPREVAQGYQGLSPVISDGRSVAGVVSVEYQGRMIHSASFDPVALKVDPETFQFKADGDAEGVTARLKGIEKWDPTASGKVIVWESNGGEIFIADGHQRRGLAARLVEQGYEGSPRLDGFLFREWDGWSPRDVRVVAALKNIREGSGTILDAAKVFREAAGAADDRSLPVTGEFIHAARGLARLSDEAFGAVVNKVIPERYASEIGTLAGDRPDMHDAIVRLMKEADPTSLDEARALVQEALLDDMVRAEGIQADLFGHVPPAMTTIARAKLKAAVLKRLRADAKVYNLLVKQADVIEAGGNALARSDNERRLQLDLATAELVNKLSLRSGEIGEAFATAAKAVTEGRRAGDLAKSLTDQIKRAVKGGEINTEIRKALIDPDAPEAAHLKDYDNPAGAEAKAQIEPKPEDADIEADTDTMGLFDDLPDDSPKFEMARERLARCAPGGI